MSLVQNLGNILRPIIDYVYNERSTRLSHIVVSVDPFDADEDAVTKCGTLARGADILPSYDWCPECWDAEIGNRESLNSQEDTNASR